MKRALITGGGIRLGRAMALTLADQGYDVAVHYASSADGARETVAMIKERGQKAVALPADLLDEAQSQELVGAAVDALGGPLTCLVNNASIFEYDTLSSATRASWDRHMESNLRAPFVLTQKFAEQAPQAITDENGEQKAQSLIVNMLDQRVRKLTPEFMSYTLAKMGLWTLTQTAARALAPHVRVNGIGPGSTVKGYRQSDEHFKNQRRNSLLERGSNPEDITQALAFLLNAPAVTGQVFCVDGGQHLNWKTPDIVGVE